MRFAITMCAAAIVLAACSGEKKAEETPAAEATPAAAPAAPAAAPAGGPAAITGKTVEVKMIGDDKGYRFEPAEVTIAKGDGVKFVLVAGGPHNVAFDAAKVPAASKAQLDANIPEKIGELASGMKMNPNETIVISFAGIEAGTYEYYCTPHLAMGMKGKIIVQ